MPSTNLSGEEPICLDVLKAFGSVNGSWRKMEVLYYNYKIGGKWVENFKYSIFFKEHIIVSREQ